MRYLTLRLLTTFLLCLVWANSSRGDEEKTVLVFGDSLSASYGIKEEQGWVTLLSEKLRQAQSPYSVINASVSGETSSGGLSRLPAVLAEFQPSVVILELGGNDGLRGLPLTTLQVNLEEMVSLSQQAGAEVLLAGIQIPQTMAPDILNHFMPCSARLQILRNYLSSPFSSMVSRNSLNSCKMMVFIPAQKHST